jgi:hypothetical protein
MTAKSVTTLDDVQTQNAATAAGSAVEDAELLNVKFDDTLSGERALVTIHSEKGEGGSNAVFLSLNGHAYQVPRDKAWNVPAELVEVLDNARQTYFEREGDTGPVVERHAPRMAYSVRSAPRLTREEAEAKAAAAAPAKRR